MNAAKQKLGMRRKTMPVAQTDWVKSDYLHQDGTGPLIVMPAMSGIDFEGWAVSNKTFVEEKLLKHGGVLFRGFEINGAAEFERVARAIADRLLEYRERSSPRHQISGNIYTSTDYPASQSIFFHNENSYQNAWPMKLFFFCETAPERGGETPIADIRRVLERISPETVNRFEQKKGMYVRNYDPGLGMPWQTVFQTTDKAAVERYCIESGIQFEWKANDGLRTRAIRPAIATHTRTGERVWFNHFAFFHVTTLDQDISDGLLSTMDEEDLPSNTYYGDGSPIEPSVLEEIRAAYRREAITFAWARRDLLLLDNMLMAHSRNPFAGARKILVAMAEPNQTLNRSMETTQWTIS